ncbi:P-loop containing nucleoside triphosphate hydrolase protein [Jimgerdemannia flammicorona]|uniref:RNA helicase n=1 Tax=Jimgerdemannia flammicorona TaxID=994334 RepID=A0A433A2F2_9FUNG|nr:P-loop containing nucleoside triphosphate hydrolase protein [Jimgerdemannia flammicorona]
MFPFRTSLFSRCRDSYYTGIAREILKRNYISHVRPVGQTALLAATSSGRITWRNTSKNFKMQQTLIPGILSGRDIFLRDQTGMGKTLGITLALLSQSRLRKKPTVTNLLIAPNRELAMQVEQWVRRMVTPEHAETSRIKRIIQVLVSGDGAVAQDEIAKQKADLAAQVPHIVVGTPSRVLEILRSGALDVSGLRTMVVDEADQALRLPKRFATEREIRNRQMHPKPAEQLIGLVFDKAGVRREKKLQLVISSATLNRPLRYFLADKDKGWIRDALFIDATNSTSAPAQITHHCLVVSAGSIRNINAASDEGLGGDDIQSAAAGTGTAEDEDWWEEYPADESFGDDDDRMLEGVATACELEGVRRGLVFVNNNTSIPKFIGRLKEHGVEAKELITSFAEGAADRKPATLLVATEHTARGVDLPDVSHVFILGIPSSATSYLHMAGRTGRMGREGKVVTFVREVGWAENRVKTMFKLTKVHVQRFEHVE